MIWIVDPGRDGSPCCVGEDTHPPMYPKKKGHPRNPVVEKKKHHPSPVEDKPSTLHGLHPSYIQVLHSVLMFESPYWLVKPPWLTFPIFDHQTMGKILSVWQVKSQFFWAVGPKPTMQQHVKVSTVAEIRAARKRMVVPGWQLGNDSCVSFAYQYVDRETRLD